jgi:hypothetical protein
MTSAELAELVVAELIGLGGWTTPPVDPVWYPDYEAQKLKTGGLTAMAIVPEGSTALASRNGRQSGEPMCHVAIVKPFAGAGGWADGKIAVDKAEAVIDRLLGKQLNAPSGALAVCLSVEHSPVISADHAKQFSLWVSYLKLKFKTSN